jgi:hypothetical protein
MSSIMSGERRQKIAISLPIMEARREDVVSAMEHSLRGVDEDEVFGQSELVAAFLFDLLVRHGRTILERSRLGSPAAAAEHDALGITGRHYSRFADALATYLKDPRGLAFPADVAASWCDLFWAVIGAIHRPRERTRG